jgi:hypothetical protein
VLYACYCRLYTDDDIEDKLASENIDCLRDIEFGQAPRKAAGEKINMLITIDPEFGLSSRNVTSLKINGHRSPEASQSPGTENYELGAYAVERS